MSLPLRCGCGWEGTVGAELAGQPVRCVACGAWLKTIDEPAEQDPVPAGGPPVVPLPGSSFRLPAVEETAATPAAPGDAGPVVSDTRGLHRNEPVVSGARPVETRSAWSVAGEIAWSALCWCGARLRPAGRYIFSACRFYWRNRRLIATGFKAWQARLFPALEDPELLRREVRLALDEDEGLRELEGVWHIDLPPRCIVCGEETAGLPAPLEKSVLDPYWLLVAPPLGLVAGVIVGWWFGSVLLLMTGLVGGLLVGYALRRDVRFLLNVTRCPRHAGETRWPELTVLRNDLLLRMGSREVKLAWLRHERGYVPLGDDPRAANPFPPAPATVTLAEETGESTEITHEASAGRLAGGDEPPSSPGTLALPSEHRFDPRKDVEIEGYDVRPDRREDEQENAG
jgi:hypothetical protein